QLAKWNQFRVTDHAADGKEMEGKALKAAEAFQTYIAAAVKLRRAIEEHKSAAAEVSAEKEKSAAVALDESSMAALTALTGKEGVFTAPKEKLDELLSEPDKSHLAGLRKDLECLKKQSPEKYPLDRKST